MKAYTLINRNNVMYNDELDILVYKDQPNVQACMPIVVHDLLRQLDLRLQEAEYILSQPHHQPFPSKDGFVPMTGKNHTPQIATPTPHLDKRHKQEKKIDLDLANKNKTQDLQRLLDQYTPIFNWIEGEQWLDDGFVGPIKCYRLGDVMQLTTNDVIDACACIVQAATWMFER